MSYVQSNSVCTALRTPRCSAQTQSLLCIIHVPLQIGPPPSPGEAPGLLCSLASTRVCPVETLAKGWCVKEERGDGFLLLWLPPALWAGLTEFSSTQGHTFPLELQLSPLLPLAFRLRVARASCYGAPPSLYLANPLRDEGPSLNSLSSCLFQ